MRWTRQRQAGDGSQGGLLSVSETTARKMTALFPPSLKLRRDKSASLTLAGLEFAYGEIVWS